jgi:hypothetical protein
MGMGDHTTNEQPEPADGFDRRRFLTKAAVGGAIAVPVVTSFSMTGVNAAFAQQTNVSGKKEMPAEVSPNSTQASTTSTTAPSTTTTTETPNQTPSTTSTTLSPNQLIPVDDER